MRRITRLYQIFLYKLNTKTILASLLHFCFHYLSHCVVHFFFNLTLHMSYSHTHPHSEKHIHPPCPSAGCSLSLSVYLCLHLLFSDRVASEVLWEVIQKLPSQGTTDKKREREMVCKICHRLFIFYSTPWLFLGSYRGHFKCLEIYFHCNNTDSPQLLHFFF